VPSFFETVLDTATEVGVQINGGNSSTENDVVTLELELDADAIEVKIWGDINPLDPANSEFGEDEASAPWITASPSFLVALTTNPGKKQLAARVKDDVWNEATDSDSIFLGEEVAIPARRGPSQRPKPLPGAPERKRKETQAHEVRVQSSGFRVGVSRAASASTAATSEGFEVRSSRQSPAASTTSESSGFRLSTSARSYIRSEGARSSVIVGAATTARIERRDDPDLAALTALDLL
jgi:hypothetical protein